MTSKLFGGLLVFSLSGLTLASQSAPDALQVSYLKQSTPSQFAEAPYGARILVKQGPDILLEQNTRLLPGCEQLPANHTLTLAGEAVSVLCGSYSGRHETLRAFAIVNGELASASLGFGEASAQLQDHDGVPYALVASSPLADPRHGVVFQAYKLERNPTTLAFVAVDDDAARQLYRARLARYMGQALQSEPELAEALQLIDKSRYSQADACLSYQRLAERSAHAPVNEQTAAITRKLTDTCKDAH
ncbi:hypothetical protein [Pseudomonas entomophila]|uniref:hypothetical protein n=1 Tax=Pseudomonas entomophila TaxID=312306 RepID=UPI0020106C3E|nr:hypothetical protein [Pseudomonas entomophila]